METKMKRLYNNILKPILIIGFIIVIGLYASWWMVILLLIGWTAYKIYKGWNTIMLGARQIEYIIWGRPLDKELWTKEQWKNRPKFKLFSGNWKFELIPSSISRGIDMKFRFALFMCIFGFSYFAIGYLFNYPKLGYFASIFYISGLFMSLFILMQVIAGAKIIYDRNKNKSKQRK